VKCEDLSAQSPRSPKPEEQRAFLRAVERLPRFEIKPLRGSSSPGDYVWVHVQPSMWMTCPFQRAKGSSSSVPARERPTVKCRSTRTCVRRSGWGSKSVPGASPRSVSLLSF
jgi:hypothetical protein